MIWRASHRTAPTSPAAAAEASPAPGLNHRFDPRRLHQFSRRGSLHICCASSPTTTRCSNRPSEQPDKQFDLVIYPADRRDNLNSLLYVEHGSDEATYVEANSLDLDLDDRSVIYKMHGTVWPQDEALDNFVITEEDYIEFLSRMTSNASSAVPAQFYQYSREPQLPVPRLQPARLEPAGHPQEPATPADFSDGGACSKTTRSRRGRSSASRPRSNSVCGGGVASRFSIWISMSSSSSSSRLERPRVMDAGPSTSVRTSACVPFTVAEQAFFFGRRSETRVVAANLFAAPLTVFYGPSAVGKSSVLQAGVIPQLRRASRKPRCCTSVTGSTTTIWIG